SRAVLYSGKRRLQMRRPETLSHRRPCWQCRHASSFSWRSADLHPSLPISHCLADTPVHDLALIPFDSIASDDSFGSNPTRHSADMHPNEVPYNAAETTTILGCVTLPSFRCNIISCTIFSFPPLVHVLAR